MDEEKCSYCGDKHSTKTCPYLLGDVWFEGKGFETVAFEVDNEIMKAKFEAEKVCKDKFLSLLDAKIAEITTDILSGKVKGWTNINYFNGASRGLQELRSEIAAMEEDGK